MNRISGVLKLHYRDKWSWIYIPAIILFFSFGVNLTVSFLVSNQEDLYTGGISSVVIYIFVAGIIVVGKTFPFAIGMSIRRIDYFIGSVIIGTISSAFFTSLIFLFAQLEKQTNGWGTRLHFFYFPYVNDGTLLEQFILYMILFLNTFFLGFLISSYARRFGRKGMFLGAMVFLLIGSIVIFLLHHFEVWGSIFSWFASHTAVQIAYWLMPFTLLYLLGSYRMLRRAVI
ncbi:hypothetical protein [Peribacillus loiseleuriae]|uniref:Uncharacterized protein n=1 Tax=Peribacillus loiseleuriae TaxID=1679170 RepID=A0A0K9GP23_9BACI|nr:hypothetical protein [Peribacillus loiseleuriae]KMY48405.1 hypothetical protein AC625_01795 [Peribacillus loiseleuriae]